jgi:phosphoglycerate dehydrogenase-like enzyme
MSLKPVVLAVAAGDNPPDLSGLDCTEVRLADPDQISRAIVGADALLVWDFTAKGVEAALRKADRLKWIHVSSAGVDHVLGPTVRSAPIVLTNARGVLDAAIAEYVLGLILVFAKDFLTTFGNQRRRVWQHRPTGRLTGARVLVVGPGSIGTAIGSLLTAVGMRVDAVGRTARGPEGPFGEIFPQSLLGDVVGSYDYLVLAAPLTSDTRGMVDATVLNAMDPGARIINVSRGQLVVERDLEVALERRDIAGAALDVVTSEPLTKESPLWAAPNTFISPHMAGDFFDWRNSLLEVFLDNFGRFQQGRPLMNLVDKSVGFAQVGSGVHDLEGNASIESR